MKQNKWTLNSKEDPKIKKNKMLVQQWESTRVARLWHSNNHNTKNGLTCATLKHNNRHNIRTLFIFLFLILKLTF